MCAGIVKLQRLLLLAWKSRRWMRRWSGRRRGLAGAAGSIIA